MNIKQHQNQVFTAYWIWPDKYCNLYIIGLTKNNYKPVIFGNMGKPPKRYTWSEVSSWSRWRPISGIEVKRIKLELL